MSKKHRIKIEELSRFMSYILGHKPYEFGLIPDSNGFVTHKELLWAIHEEPGWSHVQKGNINEVLLSEKRDFFDSDGKRIRAMERRWKLDLTNPSQSLPRLLFIGIRRKAHPVVMDNGLRRIEDFYYALSTDRNMAERIGRRHDQHPVILEIMADKAQTEGTQFYLFGSLFLAYEIQSRYIAGPLVPKDIKRANEEKAKQKEDRLPDFQAGTFIMNMDRDMDLSRRTKGRKKKGWKEGARKLRKRR